MGRSATHGPSGHSPSSALALFVICSSVVVVFRPWCDTTTERSPCNVALLSANWSIVSRPHGTHTSRPAATSPPAPATVQVRVVQRQPQARARRARHRHRHGEANRPVPRIDRPRLQRPQRRHHLHVPRSLGSSCASRTPPAGAATPPVGGQSMRRTRSSCRSPYGTFSPRPTLTTMHVRVPRRHLQGALVARQALPRVQRLLDARADAALLHHRAGPPRECARAAHAGATTRATSPSARPSAPRRARAAAASASSRRPHNGPVWRRNATSRAFSCPATTFRGRRRCRCRPECAATAPCRRGADDADATAQRSLPAT